MPKTSLEIRNDIKAARDLIAAASANLRSDDSAVVDKAREDMLRLDGRVAAMEEQLDAALAEESSIRAEGGVPLVRAEKARPKTVASVALGDAAKFSDFLGRSVSVPMDALSVAVTELAVPTETERGLPTYDMTSLSPFLSTLRQGSCDGNVTYMEATKLTNNAAGWKRSSGTQKAQSEITWTPRTANLEVIAHHIPVPKLSARRYRDLEATINNELIDGLYMARDAKAVNGSDSSGIVGVLNNANIQTYTAVSGETIVDHVRRMVTKSLLATGIHPDRVAMHPLVKEQADLLKDGDNAYLYYSVNGQVWGLPVVEDVNFTSSGSSGSTNYGMCVYWSGAATWLTADPTEVTIGLVDKQLIENSYTLLAESSHALKVVYPGAFVSLAAAVNVEA